MKRLIAAILALMVFLPGLAACTTDSRVSAPGPVSASGAENTPGPAFIPEGPTENESQTNSSLLDLLERQVYLYERGNYGIPYDAASDEPLWEFAGVFAQEAGVPYGAEGGRQELLRIMYKAWMGRETAAGDYFSDAGPSEEPLTLTLQDALLDGDKAVLVVSRVRDGVELLDARYTFRQAPAGQEVLDSLAKELTYEGFLWKYEKVEPIPDRTDYAPVTITTAEELADLCHRVNAREPDAVLGHFILGDDLDLSGFNWEPMGRALPDEDWNSAYAFARVPGGFNGTFDGAGHTVSGVSVSGGAWEEAGFFGRIGPRARVIDLTVEGSVDNSGMSLTQNSCTGGLAGRICGGAEVTGCAFQGTVDGFSYVGGFAGRICGSVLQYNTEDTGPAVSSCRAQAELTATYWGGGFAGTAWGDISDCDASGVLHIQALPGSLPSSMGGFAGEILQDISGCHSAVTVEYAIPGANRMGSFAGELGNCDILGCSIQSGALHEGWYLVGMQHYKGRTIDVVTVP